MSKVTDEGRIFKEHWTKDYYFTSYNGKPISLICKESLSVLKEYNFKRQYETKHKGQYDRFNCQSRNDKIKLFKSSLSGKKYMQ
jgi:hypothetical protein